MANALASLIENLVDMNHYFNHTTKWEEKHFWTATIESEPDSLLKFKLGCLFL